MSRPICNLCYDYSPCTCGLNAFGTPTKKDKKTYKQIIKERKKRLKELCYKCNAPRYTMDNDELVEHYDSTCWGNNNARIHKLEKALKKLLED